MKMTDFNPTLELNVNLRDRDALLEARRQIDEALRALPPDDPSPHFGLLEDVRRVLRAHNPNLIAVAPNVRNVLCEAISAGHILRDGHNLPPSKRLLMQDTRFLTFKTHHRLDLPLPFESLVASDIQTVLQMYHPHGSKIGPSVWTYVQEYGLCPPT